MRRLAEPLLRFNMLDRSLALGAQAFGALIPLMIVLEAFEPGDAGVADDLIDRFDLSGAGAEAVKEAFSVSGDQTSTTALSVDGLVDSTAGLVLSLAGAFLLGLLTPYLLLGRRLPWRRLTRQAALTAGGVTVLGIWSAIYMPRAIESSAGAYGAIGIAFALLTWLWGLGIVLVASAVYGSPQLQRRSR